MFNIRVFWVTWAQGLQRSRRAESLCLDDWGLACDLGWTWGWTWIWVDRWMDGWMDGWRDGWQSNDRVRERLAEDLLFYLSSPGTVFISCWPSCHPWDEQGVTNNGVRSFLSLHFCITTMRNSSIARHQHIRVWGGRARQRSNTIREGNVSFL